MKTMWIAAVLLLVSCAAALGRGRSVTLVPADGKPVNIVVDGKAKEYFLLGAQAPITFRADGPGRLVIVSRLKLSRGGSGAHGYTLEVLEGKKTVKRHSMQTDRSDAVFESTSEAASKSRKFSVDVPAGSFTYELRLRDAPGEAAAVRCLFQQSKGAGKLVAIEPLSYDRVVTALIAENLVAYYVATGERMVELRVVGPSRMAVSTRLNYDQSMKGAQKYSILVRESGKIVQTRSLQTTKSEGISYQEWRDVVPGRPNTFILDVPPGEHTYQIGLGETYAKSVSLRFSIPRQDLKNED